MKVFESLNQFEDSRFFAQIKANQLNEEKPAFWKGDKKDDKDDDKKDDKKDKKDVKKKNIDPAKKNEAKVAQDRAKDTESVLNKIEDNFNKFGTIAGDKIERWKEFFDSQSVLKKKLASKGIQSYYKLNDSSFVVVLWPRGKKAYLVVLDTKTPGEATFRTDDRAAVKRFKNFYKQMMAKFKEVHHNYKDNKENEKKEKVRAIEKEKIGKFLSESSKKKI